MQLDVEIHTLPHQHIQYIDHCDFESLSHSWVNLKHLMLITSGRLGFPRVSRSALCLYISNGNMTYVELKSAVEEVQQCLYYVVVCM